MQLGIVGFPKTGKTTLFNLLTHSHEATDKFSKSSEAHLAICQVPDERLQKLTGLFSPKKKTPATVQFVDVPGVTHQEGSADLNLTRLKEVAALIHVVRAFEDEEIPHPEGSVDGERDLASFDLELIFADLELVERRIERLEKNRKRGLSPDERLELELLLESIKPALENETPLRQVELAEADEKRLRGFQLLSAKPLLVVWNVSEGDLGVEAPHAGAHVRTVVMSLPIEEEISELPEDEQREFLAELGLEEPSLVRAIRASYELLGLISFFTVGEDECRAWTIREGTIAQKAAGTIHSDLDRGFIRAEVVAWDKLLEHGSMAKCREVGVLRLEGKEYAVQDGEIMHVRFNV
ncbi:MAG: redox-regulated ATPase YchF [bacterium]|nr:redox-regulated ATPase YchF [bacterium]